MDDGLDPHCIICKKLSGLMCMDPFGHLRHLGTCGSFGMATAPERDHVIAKIASDWVDLHEGTIVAVFDDAAKERLDKIWASIKELSLKP